MIDEDKLMRMFKEVHGDFESGACYPEIDCDDMGDPIGVRVMKHGNLCWSQPLAEVVFEYLTKDWEDE